MNNAKYYRDLTQTNHVMKHIEEAIEIAAKTGEYFVKINLSDRNDEITRQVVNKLDALGFYAEIIKPYNTLHVAWSWKPD